MKKITLILIWFVIITCVGCDPMKELDWNRTVKDQGLRIGNRVKVDGIRWGLAIYTFNRSNLTDNLWFKETWDTELDLSIYNPDDPTHETNSMRPINPNAPIGTVICTIYNPMHNETLTRLRDTYPDTGIISELPSMKHRFEVIGRIHSFQRHLVPNPDDTQPDISLTAVRIHVESLTLKE